MNMDSNNALKTIMTVTMMVSFLTVYAQTKEYPYVLGGNVIVCKDGDGGVSGPYLMGPISSTRVGKEDNNARNTLSERFKVASNDAFLVGIDGDGSILNWYQAVGMTDSDHNPDGKNACADYAESPDGSDKGRWRVPSLREGVLISLLNDQLTSPLTLWLERDGYKYAVFWTSNTAANYGGAWMINSQGYGCSRESASRRGHVRCVMDL